MKTIILNVKTFEVNDDLAIEIEKVTTLLDKAIIRVNSLHQCMSAKPIPPEDVDKWMTM